MAALYTPAPATTPPREARAPGPRTPERRVSWLSLGVLLLGLALTAALSTLCYVVNSRNEHRLLDLQTKEVAAAFQIVVPGIQTPLMSAAEIAEASGGNTARFAGYLRPYVGTAQQQPFVSVSLWRLDGGTSATRLETVGAPVPASPAQLAPVVASARGSKVMRVVPRLRGPHPAIWYAATASTADPHYAVFAESLVPADHKFRVRPGAAFSELHFALYAGSATPANLLESDVQTLPIRGTTSVATVPFGTITLTIVASPAQRLGGTLSAWLWWLAALIGAAISIAAAVTAEWLVRRRRTADRLRTRVETLLGEQRGIAEALQRALLPQALPILAGLDVAARYVPGAQGAEIGGDWYDVLPQADGRVFFVIGDVSGRGIPAGTVMASLRFAIRGFVSEGHGPDAVLDAAARLLDLRTDRHFATVLCGVVDADGSRVTVACAGHLPPLIAGAASAALASVAVGPPIGVDREHRYCTTTIDVPRPGLLLLYTDGLVERRGEDLDDGLARLVDAVRTCGRTSDDLLDDLVSSLIPDRPVDDTALVGLTWR